MTPGRKSSGANSPLHPRAGAAYTQAMKAWLAVLLLAPVQDPVDEQVDAALAEFEAAAEEEEAMALLLAQLEALGEAAATPIARRLADDLRDGMLSAYGPALLDAIDRRPEAIAPLQEAFRDEATSVAGRIELANVLSQLQDEQLWRDELRSIASDPTVEAGDRQRASALLESRPALVFGSEEPRTSVVDEAAAPSRPPVRPVARQKAEEKDDTSPGTVSIIVAAGLIAGIVLLLALKRKG